MSTRNAELTSVAPLTGADGRRGQAVPSPAAEADLAGHRPGRVVRTVGEGDMPVDPARSEDLPGGIDIVDEGGMPVARLRGDIDSFVVAEYDQHAPEGGPAPFPAVIDAAGVTFLDCRGLSFLIRRTADARRSGPPPLLRRPPRIVRRVIDLAGAGDFFTVIA
jgi:anti-anti-sigma factor